MKIRNGLPKHCSWNTDQNGKRRVRFRLRGFSTYLTGTPWSEPFMRAYAAALDRVKALPGDIGASRIKAGSIDALIASYRRLIFPRLAPSTRKMRNNILERFGAENGARPVNRLERRHVAAIIAAKAETPGAANNLLKVLRQLLDLAVDLQMIAANPARGVKKFKTEGDGIHTWSEDEVAQFESRHPIGSRAYLALMLMLYTGQRKSDAVRLGWQHVRGDRIALRQQKTGTPLLLPIVPELARTLASVPRTNLTFLMTERGAPFTAAGFGNWFRDRCNEAGLPQCSAHGLRHLAATRMANAGCSEREIMAVTGHRSVTQVSRYTKERDQAGLAEQAMNKTREKLSSMPTLLDKKAK
jgi:integrase